MSDVDFFACVFFGFVMSVLVVMFVVGVVEYFAENHVAGGEVRMGRAALRGWRIGTVVHDGTRYQVSWPRLPDDATKRVSYGVLWRKGREPLVFSHPDSRPGNVMEFSSDYEVLAAAEHFLSAGGAK